MHKHNKIGHAPLTAARPWDDSAWTGAVFCAGPRTVYDMQTIVILLFWSYGLHLNQIQRLWSDEIEVKKTILFAEPWHLMSVLR